MYVADTLDTERQTERKRHARMNDSKGEMSKTNAMGRINERRGGGA